MRPAGNPYRQAHPRAIAPSSRPPGRLMTLWLDVVGAAVTCFCWGYAYLRHAAAADRERARDREADTEAMFRLIRSWRRGGPFDDATPTVRLDLTQAPPRVATGAVDEPVRLALVAILNDEARAAARKE